MKKLLVIGAVALFMFSCKKDQEKGDLVNDGKKVPVTFTTGLEVIDKEYKAGVSDVSVIAQNTNYLYYILFDKQGNFIKQKTYVKDDPDFGQVKDTLVVGEYISHFFASKLPLTLNISNLSGSHIVFSENDIFTFGGEFFTGNNYYKQGLLMKRIISKLTLVVTDTVPQNASYMRITRNAAKSYYFDGSTPVLPGNLISQTIRIDSLSGKKLPPVTMTTIEKNVPLTVSISVYDVNDKLIVERYADFTPVPNKETVVTGKLFSIGAYWELLINDEWDSAKDIIKL